MRGRMLASRRLGRRPSAGAELRRARAGSRSPRRAARGRARASRPRTSLPVRWSSSASRISRYFASLRRLEVGAARARRASVGARRRAAAQRRADDHDHDGEQHDDDERGEDVHGAVADGATRGRARARRARVAGRGRGARAASGAGHSAIRPPSERRSAPPIQIQVTSGETMQPERRRRRLRRGSAATSPRERAGRASCALRLPAPAVAVDRARSALSPSSMIGRSGAMSGCIAVQMSRPQAGAAGRPRSSPRPRRSARRARASIVLRRVVAALGSQRRDVLAVLATRRARRRSEIFSTLAGARRCATSART